MNRNPTTAELHTNHSQRSTWVRRFGGFAFVALGIAIVLMLPRHQAAQAQQQGFLPAAAETFTAPLVPPRPEFPRVPLVAQQATGFTNKTYETVQSRLNSQTGAPEDVVTSVWAQAPSPPGLAAFTLRSKQSEKTRALVSELKELAKGENNEQQREKLMQSLRMQLDEEFSEMHQQQSDQIDAIEKKLDQLKERHEKRTENKQQIIDRRVDQLLGRPDDLDWYQPGMQLGSSAKAAYVFPSWNRSAPNPTAPNNLPTASGFNRPIAPPQPLRPNTPTVFGEYAEPPAGTDLSTLGTAMRAMQQSSKQKQALEDALNQLAIVKKLRPKGLVSSDALRKAERQLSAAQEQAKISQLYLQAIGERMKQSVSAEKQKLELEQAKAKETKDAEKQNEIEQKISETEAKLEAAANELELYKQALKVLAGEKSESNQDQ